MLLNTQVINSTDTELLAVLLGNRKTAEMLLRNAKGSLFVVPGEGIIFGDSGY